ncbi:MAG: cobalamin-dependent protein [Chitinophagales bacterium]
MKICLIKPPVLHKGVSFARYATPPLGLAYIAAALKKSGNEVYVIDASATGINSVEKYKDNIYLFGLNKNDISDLIHADTEVICFSFMFTNNWLYDRELVGYIKERYPNAILIAGGEHATAAPQYCMEQAPLDFIVLGEGESAVVELCNSLKESNSFSEVPGIVYRNNEGINYSKGKKRIKDIEKIPWPAWHLFPVEEYFENEMTYGVHRGRTLPIMATRGCPYDCTFCSSPLMWGRKYQMRSPKDFVDEIEHLYNTYKVDNFDLYDLTAIIVKSWIVEMCNEIIKRDLKITYQLPSGTRAEAIDFEVADLLYKSGCKNITYAPESGSDKVLKEVKKKVKTKKMLESIKYSNQAGLNIKLNMIMGFPDDTHKDIWISFWFLIKSTWYGANDAAPAIFSPYPGSELFDRLIEEGKLNLKNDDFLYSIIDSYDVVPKKVYSNNISAFSIRAYIFIFLILFYGSNYLFRPNRFFTTIYNVLKNKQESKIEQLIHVNLIKPIVLFFNRSNLYHNK